MKNLLLVLCGLSAIFFVGCTGMPSANSSSGEHEQSLMLHPIGKVVRDDGRTLIVLEKKYQPGLLGLDNFKQITVVYWFDKNDTPVKRAILQVNPRGDKRNPLTGVFGTHSPVRPNLIAISQCKIISIEENIIEVEEIDAFDDSPVLDLKGEFFRYYHPKQ